MQQLLFENLEQLGIHLYMIEDHHGRVFRALLDVLEGV